MMWTIAFGFWALAVVGILAFMRGASYKDNIEHDPDYYDKE